MPVEKDIDLSKPLSEADMRQLEADANRLEELAKKAEANSEKAVSQQSKEEQLLNDAIKKVEQLEKEADKAEKARTTIRRSITEVNQLAEHRTALSNFEENEPFEGMGGKDPFSGRLKTGRTAFGTGQENAPMGHILKLQAELEEARKQLELQKKEFKKVEKEIRDQLAEQRAMLNKVQGGFNEALQVNADPVGFGVGKLKGLVSKGGIYGLIALAVIEMAEQIFEQVKAMYAPGGPYDVRKQMEDQDRQMEQMDHLLDRRSGRVFFTSDTELHSGPPEISNTTRLGHRIIQFQNWNVGGA